jgi:hypothetical protein
MDFFRPMRNIQGIHTFFSLAGPDIVAARNLGFLSNFRPLFPGPHHRKEASLIEIAPRAAKHQQTA